MIDYVQQACKAWGLCTRWMLANTNEGFPSRDAIARASDGLLSATAAGSRRQHFPEVRLGDALLIARAITTPPLMPLPLQACLWSQYVVKARAAQRAETVGRFLGELMSTADYYRNLDRAHYFIASRLPPAASEG